MTDNKTLENVDLRQLIPELIPTPKHLIQHHLKSFNYLLTHEFPKIINAAVNNIIQSEVHPSFRIKYKRIRVLKPEITENFYTRKLYPHECRLRDLTYSGIIEVDVEIIYDHEYYGFTKPINNLSIGRIPIMLGSDYCWLNGMDARQLADIQECQYDPEGYFIIKGVEKVVLMQEQLCRNKVLVDVDGKTGLLQASCASATLETKSKIAIIIKNNRIYLKSSSFKELIPIFIIFKAMGLETDKKLVELSEPFLPHESNSREFDEFCNLMYMNFESLIQHSILSQYDALHFLSSRVKYLFKNESSKNLNEKIDEVHEILSKIMLPHIHATKENYLQKISYMGFMTKRLLRAHLKLDKMQEGQTDIRNDRDYLGNKRIECAGEMLGLLFEDLFKRFNGELKKEMDKYLLKLKKLDTLHDNIDNFVKMLCSTDTITHGLIQAISSGNWSIKRFKVDRKGVTQVLNRINHLGALGMLTRMESHIEKSRKVSGPRSLQCSHWGFICPVDTPDGENCGLVKNLALLAKITIASDDQIVLNYMDKLGLVELGIFSLTDMKRGMWLVQLNGKIVGGVSKSHEFVEKLKQLRRRGLIDKYTSILEDYVDKVIDIWTDAGRMVRPLVNYQQLLANADKFIALMQSLPSKSFQETSPVIEQLIMMGVIEYLDVNELNNCNVAFSLQEISTITTHVELGYNIILGIIAGMIPFPHHNQSPRNTYQCAMGKQALGLVGLNLNNRIDTVGYQLVYPQKPLVTTSTLRLTGFEQLAAGINATIAIMSFSGYDIEDAVVMSRGAIERGFGRTLVTKKVVVDFERGLENPGDVLLPTEGLPDGIAEVGSRVEKGDILVNKHIAVNEKEVTARPERHKGKYSARVEKVLLTSSGNNYLSVKMSISKMRIPEIGDKFSSRHGQKGVMGIKIAQSDLPFSETGWTPDIIMNPHGFPSRMTVGKLLELLSSKAAALQAKILFGNAFDDKMPINKDKNIVKDMGEILLKHGYSYEGTECLISGSTGEYVKGFVFSGPVYYQRLKHMVEDKIHARASGKKTFLTRQPLEGRAKEGGLRLGEMERDCLLAYGASEILIERFLLASDEYHCPVCEACGGISCDGTCGKTKAKVKKVRMPYPTKLLMQELISMNIRPKIKLK